jgi:hypothetical protein
MKQGKEERRGKKLRKLGPREKPRICFIFPTLFSFNSLITFRRKMWADRQHEDEIENAKGTPAHLQPCVFYFLLF